jgi:hypothetical protein
MFHTFLAIRLVKFSHTIGEIAPCYVITQQNHVTRTPQLVPPLITFVNQDNYPPIIFNNENHGATI